MEGRLTFTLWLRNAENGRVNVEVIPACDDDQLSVRQTMLVLALWDEGRGIIRGSIHHPQSGTVALVQGNQALLSIAEAIRLSIDDTLPPSGQSVRTSESIEP